MAENPPTVRHARADDLAAVMNVLDGAALEADASAVEERIPCGVLVAVDDDRILGACVVSRHEGAAEHGLGGDDEHATGASNAHVEAVAVRSGRRGQGIGSSLVGAASARWGDLTAEFDARNRPFYESLGFSITPVGEGRLRGDLAGEEGGPRD